MKKICLLSALVLSMSISQAQSIKFPAPSTSQTIKQQFGVGTVELSYSRPSVKGRQIFGNIEPYDVVWRTGANGATILDFSNDVVIGGKSIKAGKYGLLSIPGKSEWTFIITSDLNVTNAASYKAENDIVRVKSKVYPLTAPMETLTLDFGDITNSSMTLQMAWENTFASFTITTNTDELVMANIEKAFADQTVTKKPYRDAAQYYFENGKDLNKAYEWSQKAVEENGNAFWLHLLNARIAAKLGKKAEAKKSAEKTIELAKAAQNSQYENMAKDLIKTL